MGRRYKRIIVERDWILTLLTLDQYAYLTIPKLIEPELKEQLHVVSIHHDHTRDAFDIIVTHPEFDPVPECQVIPILKDYEWTMEYKRFERIDNDGEISYRCLS